MIDFNIYDKNYKDLTIDERMDIWKDYFNIFCVGEVVSDYPLKGLCEDNLTHDINVYVRHYILEEEYDKILIRHIKISDFVNYVLCRYYDSNGHKLNIVHLFRDTLKSRGILENLIKNESKIVVYRKYGYYDFWR